MSSLKVPQFGFAGCFLMNRLDLWVFLEKTHRGEVGQEFYLFYSLLHSQCLGLSAWPIMGTKNLFVK